ncbi:arginine decarboxylase [Anoxybacter fermentans]|uniref:Arginine decarboxylase n=1 Tax=Anoxybacter fermentans TaxID=1323375 RepID=A0A3Q9HPB3_9FIRM|nr:aminotransferase class I/II-fold pyridoxal phosphate-dependent enzyme [Anoxybacter fermentans]AZR72561.1 arginine decarboxylase [Anoxybacter fermentans]
MERTDFDHSKTPIFSFLQEYIKKDIIPFFVPGHKHGRGLKEFTDFLGKTVLNIDIPSLPETDNLANPIGIIREAQELMADAFGAEHAYFLVNGTSEGVQAMIRSAVKPGEEIIIPRNAHKSTIGGLILSGAVPVYVYPEIDPELGITTVVSSSTIKQAFKQNPFAKAVFVINPTYYGMVSDLKTIVRTAHRKGAVVLVDEAHGAHMGFHDDFPLTGMEVGADMSAASLHKTGGSMTQSSVLLLRGNRIPEENVKQTLNLTRTTSPSYVLMASLDVARKQLALYGDELLEKTLELARYAREEINKIEGIYAFDHSLVGKYGIYDLDETKLSIYTGRLGISGFTLERELMTRFGIGLELAELNTVLALITIGDTKESVDRLIEALKIIASEREIQDPKKISELPEMPDLIVSPREAYYGTKKTVPLEKAVGEISGEMLMAYPPGIPIVCPGERITQDILDYVKILKEQHAMLQGTADPYANYIRVLGHDS